ncbi:RBBP9/YdeN family alpha/beta hydrolase [Pontibacter burrus]|uniref:Serine hydrolase family protein n=1 Tax=Pontibacter burrus TaxID=2704466 RepID=A0A6B3LYH2_9BACT|nr:alpha/beta hydrolase [Pontibacter burrus]NEM98494.1 serine hydrolase family protein [Pontibacter burrus]
MNINIPGLRNSGPNHWQSLWEAAYPEKFYRINQSNWEQPDCEQWTARLEQELQKFDLHEVMLIGHSVGCATIVNWYHRFGKTIKGSLLVAPSDVDNQDYPKYITGFSPLPLQKLPFPTIVVASTNDHVVNYSRAKYFADCWGSDLVTLKNAGHIEPKSGYGLWDQGLELIAQLRKQTIVL